MGQGLQQDDRDLRPQSWRARAAGPRDADGDRQGPQHLRDGGLAKNGSDLNGAAVQRACAEIRERLRPLAAELGSRRQRPAACVLRRGPGVRNPVAVKPPSPSSRASRGPVASRSARRGITPHRASSTTARPAAASPSITSLLAPHSPKIEVSGLTGEHPVCCVSTSSTMSASR